MRRAVPLGLFALAGACTFGGLAEYEIGECNPNVDSKDKDVCNALNPPGDTSCTPYQCDPTTRRCAPLPRDDDRDRAAHVECGGNDCDDTDGNKKPGLAEWCDQKDNDCNGVPDDNVDAKTPKQVKDIGEKASDPVITGETQPDMFGAWTAPRAGGGKCLYSTPLPGGTGSSACALLTDEPNFEPRHAYARPLSGGTAALVIGTSPCTQGELLYRFAGSGQAAKATLGCAPAGAALPAFALSGVGDQGIGAYYEVPYAQRKEPLSACPSAGPAPLNVVLIDDAKSSASALGSPQPLVTDATSVRPPSVLSLGNRVLVVSPAGGDVGAWVLEASGGGVQTVSTTTLPGLAGARAVSASLKQDGAGFQLAVVAEIGCTPQKLALALLPLDAQGTFGTPAVGQVAAASGGFQTATNVAWQEASKEWLATWLVDGPAVRSQRLDASGKRVGPASDLQGFVGAKPNPAGDLMLLKATQSTSGQKLEFWFVPGACGVT